MIYLSVPIGLCLGRSMSLLIGRSVCVCVGRSTGVYCCRSTGLCICQSQYVSRSIGLYVGWSADVCLCRSISLLVGRSVNMSVGRQVCISVGRQVYISVWSVSLSVCLSTCVAFSSVRGAIRHTSIMITGYRRIGLDPLCSLPTSFVEHTELIHLIRLPPKVALRPRDSPALLAPSTARLRMKVSW